MKFMVAFLIATNLFVFFVYGWDKLAAIRHHWRIPESVLLLLAAAGGSPGALLAMMIFRHKIRKPKFFLGVPLILLAELAIFYFLLPGKS